MPAHGSEGTSSSSGRDDTPSPPLAESCGRGYPTADVPRCSQQVQKSAEMSAGLERGSFEAVSRRLDENVRLELL